MPASEFAQRLRVMAQKAEDSSGNFDDDFTGAEKQMVDDMALLMYHALSREPHNMVTSDWIGETEPITKMADRIERAMRHEHVCGQRHTSGPVIVERA